MLSCLHRHDDIRIYHKEALALMRVGYNVAIACPGSAPPGFELPTYSLALPRSRLSRMAVSWLAGVRAGIRSGAAVVHIHDPELLPAGLVLRAIGKCVVYDAHEDLPKQMAHKGYIPPMVRRIASYTADILERAMAGRLDMVVGATPRIAARLGGICVRNLPDMRELTLPRLPKKLGQICYIGLLSQARGVYAMAAAAKLAGVALVLAGEWESDELKEDILSGRSRNIRYLGRLDRPEILSLLAESVCGLCVLEDCPAYREAMPIKLMEYMAAGLPFVASDFPHWREIGAGGGLYVPPGSPRMLAEAIRSIVEDESLADRLSAAGRAVAAQLKFEKEEEKLQEAYKHMLLARAWAVPAAALRCIPRTKADGGNNYHAHTDN